MATVKVKFRPSTVRAKEGTLYYQVIHNRVARQIRTGYKLFPTEWDRETADIIVRTDAEEERARYLSTIKARVEEDCFKLQQIIIRLVRNGAPYTANQIVALYLNSSISNNFLAFAHYLISQLKRIGRMRTAESYLTTLNSFMRFRGERGDIPLEEMDATLIMGYENFLKASGICPNTTSYYMRNLRAMYNRAVEQGLTEQRNPFKHVYTGIDKTVKRAVPLRVIRQIRDLDLTLNPQMDYARDIFMFSFYTRGMSFIDMAFLKKENLCNGILSYRRRKTRQQLSIKWEKPMQDIVDKYDTGATPYLLPIVKANGVDERRQYINAEHLINNKLKKLGRELGLAGPLTTYVARHGWASIAKSKNIPIAIISEAMGHDSENTTRIYLASLDTSVVDKVNSLILKSL